VYLRNPSANRSNADLNPHTNRYVSVGGKRVVAKSSHQTWSVSVQGTDRAHGRQAKEEVLPHLPVSKGITKLLAGDMASVGRFGRIIQRDTASDDVTLAFREVTQLGERVWVVSVFWKQADEQDTNDDGVETFDLESGQLRAGESGIQECLR
jgi:hypothetical protein